MLSILLLTSCLTSTVRLDPLPDYKEEYQEAETAEDGNIVLAKYVLELQEEIYKLWAFILKSDKKRLRVIDLRSEKGKKRYKKYIEEK